MKQIPDLKKKNADSIGVQISGSSYLAADVCLRIAAELVGIDAAVIKLRTGYLTYTDKKSLPVYQKKFKKCKLMKISRDCGQNYKKNLSVSDPL